MPMTSTADTQVQRVHLYEWLHRVSAGTLSIDEVRNLDHELIIRGLVHQSECGDVTTSTKGRQFIFQCDCQHALLRLSLGMDLPDVQQVRQWLLDERFVLAPTRVDEH